jgi:hypothetical protein
MSDDIFAEVERYASKLRAQRDKAKAQAESGAGDREITAALSRLVEGHRLLVGFLHDFEQITGRRTYVKESRVTLRELVGSADLQRRLAALRHGGLPTVTLPKEAKELLDRLRAVAPKGPPKIFEGRAEFVQYLKDNGLTEETPGYLPETAAERRAKYE